MEKLLQTHKNLVVVSVTILSILFAINVICDYSFRVVNIGNPLFLILLIGTVIPYLISMVSGFDTENLISASAVAIGIMLIANALGGHEALVIAEVIAGGIGVLILFFIALSLSGKSSDKDKTKEPAKPAEKVTSDGNSSKFFIGVLIFMAILVYLASSRSQHTENSPPNTGNAGIPPLPNTTAPAQPTAPQQEAEAGYE